MRRWEIRGPKKTLTIQDPKALDQGGQGEGEGKKMK